MAILVQQVQDNKHIATIEENKGTNSYQRKLKVLEKFAKNKGISLIGINISK